MPSTATLTSFYSFTPLTLIRSAQVNENFSAFRGHIIPIDPNTATAATTMTYDLGAADHRWRNVYGSHVLPTTSTTGSYTLLLTDGVHFSNPTPATATVTLPTLSSVPAGKVYDIKNISATNSTSVVGSGAETIDGTTTISIFYNESLSVISSGSAWQLI